MQDNELYSYFRERKDSFNELPDGKLWTGIDARLGASPSRPPAGKILGLILLIAAMAGGIAIATLQDTGETAKPEQAKPAENALKIEEASTNVVQQHALKPEDTVKNKKFVRILSRKPQPKFQRLVTPAAVTAPAQPVLVEAENGPATAKVDIRTYGSTIKVRALEQLNAAAFDTLVAQSLRTYAAQKGKVLLVTAEGHKPYRVAIGKFLPTRMQAVSYRGDTLSLRPEPIKFKSAAPRKATFTEVITFVTDSLPAPPENKSGTP